MQIGLATRLPAEAPVLVVGAYEGRQLTPSAAALDGRLGGRLRRAMTGRFTGGTGQHLDLIAPSGFEGRRTLAAVAKMTAAAAALAGAAYGTWSGLDSALGRGNPGTVPPGVVPPRARRLTGPGDHRVHEDQRGHWDLGGDQGRGEPAERLGDQHHVVAAPDRARDQIGVFGQAGGRVVTGQVDRDRLVTRLAQQRHDAVPVPGGASGAGDQDEGVPLPGRRPGILGGYAHAPNLGLKHPKIQLLSLEWMP